MKFNLLYLVFLNLIFISLCLIPENSSSFKISRPPSYHIYLKKEGKGEKLRYRWGKKIIDAFLYRVKKGDYLWKIIKRSGSLKNMGYREFIEAFKVLNPQIENPSLIYPDQTLFIPINISKIKRETGKEFERKESQYRLYRVKRGDSIYKILRYQCGIDKREIHRYFAEIKRLNPQIEDLNRIRIGQLIKIPILSVYKRLKEKRVNRRLLKRLMSIFSGTDIEIISDGEYFISTGKEQDIRIKARRYPMLISGKKRILLDLSGDFPKNLKEFIESRWKNYVIVNISSEDISDALIAIFRAMGYEKIYRESHTIPLSDGIGALFKADLIVSSERDMGVNYIIMVKASPLKVPLYLREYLKGEGIEILPLKRGEREESQVLELREENISLERDIKRYLKLIFNLASIKYQEERDVELHVSHSDMQFEMKTSFFIERGGKKIVIVRDRIPSPIMDLIDKKDLHILSFKEMEGDYFHINSLFEILGIRYSKGRHIFWVMDGKGRYDLGFIVKGISFRGRKGRWNLITSLRIPIEIVSVINKAGYRLIQID